ncbi:MAG: pentapeptide repeat-containing protein [Nitrospinae bacterium]|nr:pentapeptide repeat-containing protein [Nitrospinota bacterium]
MKWKKRAIDLVKSSWNKFHSVAFVFSIILALLLVIFILWVLPINIVSDLTLNDQVKREYLIIEHRRSLLQLLGGLVVILGIYIAWRRSLAHERQANVQHESQITERFTRAVEQLGDDKVAVCLGGIYGLERIAKDSPDDHVQIMELLTAFVRESCPLESEEEENMEPSPDNPNKGGRITLSIQAVLSVVGRRKWIEKETESLNLSKCHLEGADLHGANLEGAYLQGAIISQSTKFSNNIVIKLAEGIEGEIISFNIEKGTHYQEM